MVICCYCTKPICSDEPAGGWGGINWHKKCRSEYLDREIEGAARKDNLAAIEKPKRGA